MQTPVRYYITCDDDRPVVRTIPVAVRSNPRPVEQPDAAATLAVSGQDASRQHKPRVSKLSLVKARRLRMRAHHS
ncbi:MAG TPA: hypothetical protein VFL82_05620 [Thermomicrobiales bacterium]|nr:hypothetical protein [Thermomicrobiales bacterium]